MQVLDHNLDMSWNEPSCVGFKPEDTNNFTYRSKFNHIYTGRISNGFSDRHPRNSPESEFYEKYKEHPEREQLTPPGLYANVA